jgi:hypothetical protein
MGCRQCPVLSALLDRLSFGAGPAELGAAAKLGPRACIEEQLQPTDDDPRLRIRYGNEGGGVPRVDELRPLALLEQPAQALWPLTDRATPRRGARSACATVVVLSEFGRRLRANGSNSTDHGHGGVLWVLDTRARALPPTDWPGLAIEQLDRGLDLRATRDVQAMLQGWGERCWWRRRGGESSPATPARVGTSPLAWETPIRPWAYTDPSQPPDDVSP